jgi:hypothetical protein
MIGLFGALSSPAAPAGETEQEAMKDIREAIAMLADELRPCPRRALKGRGNERQFCQAVGFFDLISVSR